MMTVGKVGGGRIWYYETLGREDDNDYYAKKEGNELEREGVFIGTGAERIELEDKAVENKVFRKLMQGFDPTGKEAWVQNAGKFEGSKRDRMPAWDVTFSAPKSVSIAGALGSDETRCLIEKAHLEAIKETVKELEEKCIVRKGKGGSIRENGGFMLRCPVAQVSVPGAAVAAQPDRSAGARLRGLPARKDCAAERKIFREMSSPFCSLKRVRLNGSIRI